MYVYEITFFIRHIIEPGGSPMPFDACHVCIVIIMVFFIYYTYICIYIFSDMVQCTYIQGIIFFALFCFFVLLYTALGTMFNWAGDDFIMPELLNLIEILLYSILCETLAFYQIDDYCKSQIYCWGCAKFELSFLDFFALIWRIKIKIS